MSHNRVAIVTGAARGIGAATAVRLAADGHAVAVVDLAEESCKDTVEQITNAGGRALAVGADVADRAQVDDAVARVAAELGPPAVLVNNAGILRDNLLFKMTDDDWDAVLAVHLRGAFLFSRAAQAYMTEQKLRPDRQPVEHLGARQPGPGQLRRGQGRLAGLHQDAGDRAGAVRGHGERGRAGPHRDRHDGRDRRADEGQTSRSSSARASEQIPVRRAGTPEDIAHTISFLASEGAGFVSGQVIYVAGGPRA